MKHLSVVAVLSALLVGGAMCGTTTNRDQKNTNTATKTNVNTSSRTSGSFSTGTTNTSTLVQINLTASGLDQPLVTVNVGARVEFRNVDTVAHQLTANTSSATDESTFGQRLEPNSTYSYLCNERGTIAYHDSLRATDTNFQGSIVVK